jgi:hypothetical protein
MTRARPAAERPSRAGDQPLLAMPRPSADGSATARVEALVLVALLAMSLASRLWVLNAAGQLSSDEAVPGLMARHILVNAEFPAFFWGQDYFGAAEEYLIAAVFAIFGIFGGPWPWLVFVPALIASLVLVVLTWSIANWIGPRPAGLVAAVPMAIASPIFTRDLVSSGGGFALSFALILGAWLCVMCGWPAGSSRSLTWTDATDRSVGWIALFSFLAGFAFWTWQPALAALPPLLLLLLLRRRRVWRPRLLVAAVVPALVGLFPMLLFNAQNGWPTLSSLVRKAGEAQPTGAGQLGPLATVGSLLMLALGGGDDSAGGANQVQGALLAAALIGVPIACLALAVARPTPTSWRRATGVSLVLVAAALHTFAAYEVTRYFVPAFAAACVMAGVGLALLVSWLAGAGRVAAGALLALLVASNLTEYPQTAGWLAGADLSSIQETQVALAALQQRGLVTGYADYWAAYPLTYLSGERIIVAPDLPFLWRARTDRYPPYSERVGAVTDPRRLFALVDQRCALAPIVAPLDAAGATYRLDPVARWTLMWDLRVRPGTAADTLAAWRSAIEQSSC